MNIRLISFIILILLPLELFSTTTIEMAVGERRTISLSNPPSHLKGCIWTSSFPDDVVFDPYPGSYSTSATIKALHPIGSSRCIIHCEYKYLELDPVSGQYIYQRSGYEDWYVTVKANDPTNVVITPASYSLFVGEYVRLQANLYPSGSSSTFEWWLDNINIASFNQTQQDVITVIAHAPGVVNANVRTANGLTSRCMITINSKDPTSISLKGPSSMIVGEQKTLTPTIEPTGASTTLTWESNKPNVIEVNNGIIKAISAGTARITVSTHNGKSAYCDIQVKNAPPKPTSINVPAELTVYTTMTKKLVVSLEPEDAETSFAWTTKDSSIASVSAAGFITGKKEGVVIITVSTANGLSADCKVTVVDMPAGLTSSKIQNRVNNINSLFDRTINKVPAKQ